MALKVVYSNAPNLAGKGMTITSSEHQVFGDASGLTGNGFKDTPWATLEPGSWLLDGTRELINTPGEIGWWSAERSDNNGSFQGSVPYIKISFNPGEQVSAPGTTFRFSPSTNEWCNEMRITWRFVDAKDPNPDMGGDIIAQETVFPDSADWYVEKEVDGFNIVVFEFLGTNVPRHFLKMQSIQMGQTHLFFQDEIVSVSILNEFDPVGCELSADEMTIEVRDKKNRSIAPQEGQKIEFYQNDKLIAAHYLQKFTREGESKYTFKCNSAISMLDDTFLGGFYENERLQISQDDVYGGLLVDVLGNIPFYLDPKFAFETVTGYLPVCTRREALQQIAFVIGASITTQGSGSICIKPIADNAIAEPVSGFGDSAVFAGSTLTKEVRPTKINVVSHNYQKSDEAETLLRGVEVANGEVIVFDEPHWGYEVTAGSEIIEIEAHDNWVKIFAESPGSFTLTGKKYIHSTTDNIWKSTQTGSENAVEVKNATLVSKYNVRHALERMVYYYSLPNLFSGTVVVKDEQAGDVVEIVNPYGNNLTSGYITSMESDFTSNGHTASIKIRGVDVPRRNAEVLKL